MNNTQQNDDRSVSEQSRIDLNTADFQNAAMSDATMLRNCAAMSVVLLLLLIVLGTAAGIATYYAYGQVRKQVEAAEAEKQRLRDEAEERISQGLAQKQAAEREALAAEQILKQVQAAEAKRVAEEQLAAIRKIEEDALAATEKAEREQEVRAAIQNFHALAHTLSQYQQQSNGRFILPNGGQAGSGLSWRVHLLPYLGLMDEYRQFHLEEPWNSPHNLPLLNSMPAIFGLSEEGKTLFRSMLNVDGQGWPYDELHHVTDGADETVAIYWAGATQAIEWTKPDDSEFLLSTSENLPNLGWEADANSDVRTVADRRLIMFCDGSVATYGATDHPAFAALLTPRGGEVVSLRMLDMNRFILNGIQTTLPNRFIRQTLDDELKSRESQMDEIGRAIQEFRTALANSGLRVNDMQKLSWRVYLLPYLGEQELFARFNLDEPWDGPTNFELIQQIPKVFQTSASIGRTQFCVASNSPSDTIDLRQLLSQQFPRNPDLVTWCYYVAPHRASYWTQPDAITISAQQTNSSLGWSKQDPIMACTLSGKRVLLPSNLHPSITAALIASSNGEAFFDLDEALLHPKRPLQIVPPTNPPTPIAGVVQLPLAQAVPPASQPTIDLDHERLRKVAFAIHAFYDDYHKSPTHINRSNGQPSELSWRVHILPYLDQRVLYEQFDLNEPWNSTKNLQATQRMPEVYGISTDNFTDVCILNGDGALLQPRKWMSQCTDGLCNTIMLVQPVSDQKIAWTEPKDIQLDGLDVTELADGKASFNVTMADGNTIPVSADLPNNILHALGTGSGGELIDAGTISRLSHFILGLPVTSEGERNQMESNRLKRVALAMHNYESAFKYFPPGRKTQSPTAPLDPTSFCLSWRVHILPFLEMQALYSQFRLTEPWDSPHNLQLLPLMPDIFRDEADEANSSTTRVQIVTGEGSAYPEVGIGPRLRDITDGTGNTLCVLIAPPSKAVPWTQPEDFRINWVTEDPDELRRAGGIAFSTFDASVKRLPPDFEPSLLKSLMTSQGGELIDSAIFSR